jgi:threonine synthase
MYYLADFRTKQKVTPSNMIFTGKEAPWEVVMDLDQIRARVNIDNLRQAPPVATKYLPFMPIKNYSNFVSMKEGASPLIKSKKVGPSLNIELYFKLESQNPTGSFKDRGSAVELTIAKELGAPGIVVASTGNMAASCSCYAAAAQIPCFVFVPEDTPPSKLCQAISYGGRIVQVKGSYNDAAALAEQVAAELGFYLAGDYAYRVEGQKTAAFEVVDQLYFNPPEVLLCPIGCGTNITAYAKGFKEYLALGVIDRVPRLIGVQAEGAASVVNAYQKNSRNVETLSQLDTICSAIAVKNPIDGMKALDAIYSTSGEAVAVSDKETLEAQFMLSREEGLFVEASCATAVAALIKLCKSGSFVQKRVVCVLTGSGLKDPAPLLNVLIKPPTIYPTIQEFLQLYENRFFEGKTVSVVDKNQVLFKVAPTLDELKSSITLHFQNTFNDAYLNLIQQTIAKFLMKGKPVTFADMQDIVQDVLETAQKKTEPVMTVKDFEVHTGKDRKPDARVVVTMQGRDFEAQADGVGPVDAVINALQKACGEEMNFSLGNYKVAIRSQGTNAVVYVELKLSRNGTISVGKGTSPDIIQASIEAFESAYNGFSQ